MDEFVTLGDDPKVTVLMGRSGTLGEYEDFLVKVLTGVGEIVSEPDVSEEASDVCERDNRLCC